MATGKKSSKKKSFTPIPVVIYGIFSTSSKKVLMVSLSEEDMKTELDLGDYDDSHAVVEMTITLYV